MNEPIIVPGGLMPGQVSPETPRATRSKIWHSVAIRMADEGIPVRAIVRSLMLPYDEVRQALNDANERGMIISIPRDDWPPGVRRDDRVPATIPMDRDDGNLVMLAMRTFSFTQTEAKLVLALLRRPGLTKGQMHTVTQKDDHSRDPSQLKTVDVYVCKIRAKFKKYVVANPDFHVEIVTQWSEGYYLPVRSKEHLFEALQIKHDTFAIPAGAESDVKH